MPAAGLAKGLPRARTTSSGRAVPALGTSLVACATLLVGGCGMSDGVIATMGMPTSETAPAGAGAQIVAQPPEQDGGVSSALKATPKQRAYLEALTAAGVHPSSELLALSIGSYVCQARAADHSDQEVWDFVLPMVRGDVRDSHLSSQAPPAGEVNSVTADYIRIATERLC
jgi:hypothetical protein